MDLRRVKSPACLLLSTFALSILALFRASMIVIYQHNLVSRECKNFVSPDNYATAMAMESGKNELDGCYHVYLDIGTNVGIQIRKLYEPR